jgi:hypothetical protein
MSRACFARAHQNPQDRLRSNAAQARRGVNTTASVRCCATEWKRSGESLARKSAVRRGTDNVANGPDPPRRRARGSRRRPRRGRGPDRRRPGAEVGHDRVQDHQPRAVLGQRLLELGKVLRLAQVERLIVQQHGLAVGAQQVEPRAQRVAQAVLGSEDERLEGSKRPRARQALAARAGGRQRRRDPALALARIPFEQRQLAAGDVGPPQEDHLLRRHLRRPADLRGTAGSATGGSGLGRRRAGGEPFELAPDLVAGATRLLASSCRSSPPTACRSRRAPSGRCSSSPVSAPPSSSPAATSTSPTPWPRSRPGGAPWPPPGSRCSRPPGASSSPSSSPGCPRGPFPRSSAPAASNGPGRSSPRSPTS